MPSRQAENWTAAIVLAGIQVSVAIFAVYSSNQDVLSDGACLGGVFGTAANVVIAIAGGLAAVVLSLKSFKAGVWHPWCRPAMFLCLSSGAAIWIGAYAALRCTV